MTWSSAIDAQVRAGRAPDDAVIEEVARTEAVRLGSAGAVSYTHLTLPTTPYV